ncbi:replication-associated recombination protein RarA [Finegoldia magna]|uniref:replication-associated recombination protein A n=1 Tax=Finegoldia magna TaxID=1260 RepID=UPI000B91B5F3|nr:replication-associated recombination protein A [Finegoldia magna]OXZ40991.1 replication-associated recombination protein RarA [Finegoldia magna]
MDLFEYNLQLQKENSSPLANRLRPKSLDKYFGQSHVVGEGKLLNRLIKADKIPSMIFYGPPGTGKTTLAEIISNQTNSLFERLSAISSGVKDIREVISIAKTNLSMYNKKTVLFIDEIHRFNKSQQDALLGYVEDGTITLIGATTENPFFEVNKALLSRCQIIELKPLTDTDIRNIIENALTEDKKLREMNIQIDEKAIEVLVNSSNGDARSALNALEIAVESTDQDNGCLIIDEDAIKNSVFKPVLKYDKEEDHYNVISAFIKSMRGSDIDAALYYLARMIESGEDPKFIARRMVIFASEDIGLANPEALTVAINVFNAVNLIGLPECRINLSNGVIYLASSEKSNTSYVAIDKALEDIRQNKIYDVPDHLKDAHYDGAKSLNRGIGYKYPHSDDSYQQYLPDELKNQKYYDPKDIGYESKIYKKMRSKE